MGFYLKHAKNERIPFFVVQWHLTTKCDQNCVHCYMKDSHTFKSELKNELDLSECKEIINQLSDLSKRWNIKIKINFTGGDPLLNNNFWKIINYTLKKKLQFGILGNPYHLTQEVAKRLKEKGILQYQLSLDGMKKLHDNYRKKGSYESTLKAIKILKNNQIKVAIMFTLNKENSKDILKVIDLCNKLKIDVFDFSRVVPLGNGKKFKKNYFTPKEYKKILLKILKKYDSLSHSKTLFGRKENLWTLLYFELGRFQPTKAFNYKSGCGAGFLITILSNGAVYSCRRLPINIGQLPRDKIREIILRSKFMNKIRDIKNFSKCFDCNLKYYCRGCPAIAFAKSKNAFKPDPYCWKEKS